MKECKDCKFYDKLPQNCKHNRAVIPQPSVDGNYYYPTSIMRHYSFLCGPQARFFVKKTRFWGSIFGRLF